MKLVLLVAFAACAYAVSVNSVYETAFANWQAEHGKSYATEAEEAERLAVFIENVNFVNKHNAEYAQGLHGYNVALNKFADLSSSEFAKLYLSKFQKTREDNTVWLDETPEDSVDWRTKGAVTPVKNQGQCGSCWSFSTTGSVEGAVAIATGKLTSLSEQQLCDCSRAEGNMGCNGGLMDNAFKYIISNGGLDSEADYPYTARDGSCDKAKAAHHVSTISSFVDVPHNNEDQLAAAVAKGPVSVAIEADQSGFQMYHSGIFDGPCGTQLDHGVLVVGYGTSTEDYWIVKNSWGASWGDAGYIKLKRGASAEGLCGIAMQPSYPVAGSVEKAPEVSHYEDPNAGPCQTGELAVQIEGIQGKFCSPSCSSSSPCPTDVPTGTTAAPECVLEAAGSSSPTNCALICNPSANPSQNGCPDKATCKPIQTVGICTYDS